ncbi:MAG: ABC transporter permease subunit [Chloroflexota bacterium]|nr:ABC transporter permease subunit [Chloroflexota bacterium]
MRNAWNIARRELYAYFSSPIAYVTMAAFLAVMGLLFWLIIVYSQQAVMAYTLGSGWLFFTIILYAAVVTMRLLAEEQRSGTIELVLTAPVRDWELVVGKYLASLLLFLTMVAVSLYQPYILARLGDPDLGATASGYLGFVLVGAALLAIGTLTSTFTRNQVVAAILSIAIGVALWLVEFVGSRSPGTLAGDFITQLAIFSHYPDFLDGIIDTQHVVYYLSLVAVCLFLATRVLETRRWR